MSLKTKHWLAASYQPVYNSLHIVRVLAPNLFLRAAEITILALALCWVVGRWDYWHGTVRQEGTVGAKSNPATVDQFRWMKLMAEGKTEEAAKIVEKWAEQSLRAHVSESAPLSQVQAHTHVTR